MGEHDPGERRPPAQRAQERETLLSFLHWQRDTLAMKCAGLPPTRLARRGVETSALSLLGLLRHLAEAERHWGRRVVGGEDVAGVHPDDSWEGAVADPAVAEHAWDAWRAECTATDDVIATAADLDALREEAEYGTVSVRWILVHLIEEYARHNGHADLIRESIDGTTGE